MRAPEERREFTRLLEDMQCARCDGPQHEGDCADRPPVSGEPPMSDRPSTEARAEFERHRNCAHCGQRLIHSQYDNGAATVFSKRCPRWELGNDHDLIEHRHKYPYRNRRGQVSDGTKARMFGPDDPWNILVDDSGFEAIR